MWFGSLLDMLVVGIAILKMIKLWKKGCTDTENGEVEHIEDERK